MSLTKTPRDCDVGSDLETIGLEQCFSSCGLLSTAQEINLVGNDHHLKQQQQRREWNRKQ
jgi:hypothetical protein